MPPTAASLTDVILGVADAGNFGADIARDHTFLDAGDLRIRALSDVMADPAEDVENDALLETSQDGRSTPQQQSTL